MSNVLVVGNLVTDPELRYTTGGSATASFTVCENRKRGDESEAHFYEVICWKKLAENVSESLTKGMRIIVNGQLQQRSWETPDGSKRSKVEIVAWQVGPSLEYASCEVTKNARDDER